MSKVLKTILCYGDSNTWGDPPSGVGRHPRDTRWPSVLQNKLGSDYYVVEEGLCGRTTVFDDPMWPQRNGLEYLPIALETHYPLDLVIIMLGTNDVKQRYNQSAFSIAKGASLIVEKTMDFEPAISDILLVSPPPIVPTEHYENTQNFGTSIEKSKELAKHYSYFADQLHCHFLDAGAVSVTSDIDGVHLDAKNHLSLAQGIYEKVIEIMGE